MASILFYKFYLLVTFSLMSPQLQFSSGVKHETVSSYPFSCAGARQHTSFCLPSRRKAYCHCCGQLVTSANPAAHTTSVCISRDWKGTVGCLCQLSFSFVNGLYERGVELFHFFSFFYFS